MSHPFNLDISELEAIEIDFVEELTEAESAIIGGGISAADPISGEQGGCIIMPPLKIPQIKLPPGYATTEALGEEGGDVTTMALGEESGSPIGLELS